MLLFATSHHPIQKEMTPLLIEERRVPAETHTEKKQVSDKEELVFILCHTPS